ncbi:MAG: hypothetical protein IID45_09825 [Planctomycetes bacterium]|nr:hypothetical protein [Planctomycetota bacterium]
MAKTLLVTDDSMIMRTIIRDMAASDGWEIVGTQLQTESMRGAYVLIGLPGYERESTVANLPIIEMLLNQINLIASLIDKNNQLHLHQLKHLSQTAAN